MDRRTCLDRHSEYVIFIFQGKIGCSKVSQCYVISTVPLLSLTCLGELTSRRVFIGVRPEVFYVSVIQVSFVLHKELTVLYRVAKLDYK